MVGVQQTLEQLVHAPVQRFLLESQTFSQFGKNPAIRATLSQRLERTFIETQKMVSITGVNILMLEESGGGKHVIRHQSGLGQRVLEDHGQ